MPNNKGKQKLPRGRFLIAFDSEGMHIRKTLCVTYHGESGEVSYDCKPAYSLKNKVARREIIKLIKMTLK
jgi:hypothetical protein